MRKEKRNMETTDTNATSYLCTDTSAEDIVRKFIEVGRPEEGPSADRFYELCKHLFDVNWKHQKFWVNDGKKGEGILTKNDLFQSTMYSVLAKLETYDQEESFANWYYTICNRACRKEFNQIKQHSSVLSLNVPIMNNEEDDRELMDTLQDGDFDFTQGIIVGSWLEEVLGELKDNYRAAVILKIILDYDTKEIAQMYHVKESTVNNWIHRGKERLRVLVCKDDPGFDYESEHKEEREF